MLVSIAEGQTESSAKVAETLERIGFLPLDEDWVYTRSGEIEARPLLDDWWIVDGLGLFPSLDSLLTWVGQQVRKLVDKDVPLHGIKFDLQVYE